MQTKIKLILDELYVVKLLIAFPPLALGCISAVTSHLCLNSRMTYRICRLYEIRKISQIKKLRIEKIQLTLSCVNFTVFTFFFSLLWLFGLM